MGMGIGLIGLGIWGERHAQTIARAGGTVAACFARTEQTRVAFAAKHGGKAASSVDELLAMPEVEAVIIATPHSTHADIACKAAQAGKHVLLEKPFALKVADGMRAIEASKRAGTTLQLAHFRRRVGAMRELKRLQETTLGQIHHAEATMDRPVVANDPMDSSWRTNVHESPLGSLTVNAVHWIDALQYLLGPVESVFARSKKLNDADELDDATVLILEFEAGPLAYIGTSLRVPRKFSVKLMGTGGAAWTDDTGDFDATRLYHQELYDKFAIERPVERTDALLDQFLEFERCCREGSAPETGGQEGLDVVSVLEAAIASNDQARTVRVDRDYVKRIAEL